MITAVSVVDSAGPLLNKLSWIETVVFAAILYLIGLRGWWVKTWIDDRRRCREEREGWRNDTKVILEELEWKVIDHRRNHHDEYLCDLKDQFSNLAAELDGQLQETPGDVTDATMEQIETVADLAKWASTEPTDLDESHPVRQDCIAGVVDELQSELEEIQIEKMSDPFPKPVGMLLPYKN